MINLFNSYCKNFVGYFPDSHSFWKILPGHNAMVVIFFINADQSLKQLEEDGYILHIQPKNYCVLSRKGMLFLDSIASMLMIEIAYVGYQLKAEHFP